MRLNPRAALAIASTAAVAASLVTASSASADPEVTAEDVEAIFGQAEAMNEEVNQLGEDVKKTQRQIDDLTGDIARQQKLYDSQRDALGSSIAQQQMDAPLGATVDLVTSGDPQQFLDGLGAVQALNATRADELDSFAVTAKELGNRRDQLEQKRAEIAADKKSASAKQAKIKAKYRDAKAELARLDAAQQKQFNTSVTTFDGEVDASGRAKKALDFALAQLGDPYVYGGTGPDGWDCSGLVQGSYAAAGVSLPRVVGPQMSAVKRVSMDSLQPGDLVAYGDMSHDGLYVGDGKVVHAPRPGKSVEITGLSGFTVAGRVG